MEYSFESMQNSSDHLEFPDPDCAFNLKMNSILLISLLILNLVNVFLHGIGSTVLIYLYPKTRQKAQQLYLIHLSVSECIMNVLESIRIIAKLSDYPSNSPNSVVEKIRHHILIIAFTGVSFVFYFDMIYITVDRLMIVVLNHQYTRYWNKGKAKLLLLLTWCGGVVISMLVTVTYVLVDFDWEAVFFKYFYPIAEFAFIILAFLTYGFILRKYHQSRRSVLVHPHPQQIENAVNFRRIFKKSLFIIPILLITTFLIFMIIPDLTFLFVGIINESPSVMLSTACWLSYGISNFLDALIYIYFQNEVRNFIMKKLRWKRPVVGQTARKIVVVCQNDDQVQ